MALARIVCVLLLTTTTLVVSEYPREQLYPHGSGLDRQLSRQDDVSSQEIRLAVPIVFYGDKYESIFVNSNGLLSFQTEIPMFFNIQFPLDYPIIAPLYTNVDIRSSGTISYRETQETDTLARANRVVQEHFSTARNFQARSVFIATWNEVGYHDNGADKLNTFQVIIASDGEDSYVEFIYPKDGIQWIQGTGGESGLPDARAQAGLVSGERVMYTLPGSGTDKVVNLMKLSNMLSSGQWIFHVGKVEAIEEPDVNNELVARPQSDALSCVQSYTREAVLQCHSKAKCKESEEGSCCICQQGYYGNGKSCLKNDVPLRVNGKVNGQLNGATLEQLDLQSYIVMTDGRAYTAISRVPRDIGYSVQMLQVLGGLIGFLFAKPIGDVMNGYQLTGGVFNHSATIDFHTGEQVKITHTYSGLDVFDQLRLEVNIQGTAPQLNSEIKLALPDYEESYTLTAPGSIISHAKHAYRNTETQEEYPYSIQQYIDYNVCKYASPPDHLSWKLKVSKNFIGFENKEQIIRFGMSNKVTPISADSDPCADGKAQCGAESSCIADGDSFRCVCNAGYQLIYNIFNVGTCVDINECQVGLHNCDKDAVCYNEPGRFYCQCKQGFDGDGVQCRNIRSCSDITCGTNAECVEEDEARCLCLQGYIGDGQICVADKRQPCDLVNNCAKQARCVTREHEGSWRYECVCDSGYDGNGYVCRPASIEVLEPEPAPVPTTEAVSEESIDTNSTDEQLLSRPEPQCYNDSCNCPWGYNYDEHRHACSPIPGVSMETMGPSGKEPNCNVERNCHARARCLFSSAGGYYKCLCDPPLTGDGYRCDLDPSNSCTDHDACDGNATCQYNETNGENYCECNEGYTGDGIVCAQASCDVYNNCHPRADCMYSADSERYECICAAGYEGNGLDCEPVDDDDCSQSNICGENSQCYYDRDSQQHHCRCNSDSYWNGVTCELAYPTGTPEITNLSDCTTTNVCRENEECVYSVESDSYGCECIEGYARNNEGRCINWCGAGKCVNNAKCAFDRDHNAHYCKCNQGYIGDGITECKLGCQIAKNCAEHAECIDDQCRCYDGYFGDGYHCSYQRTCLTDPYMCDVHATCHSESGFCECNPGYAGNGSYCKLIPKHDGNFLLLNQGMATLRLPFNPTPRNPGRPIQIQYYQMAIGLDIDCYEGRVYWSDITGKAIKSSAYNGTGYMDFLVSDIGSPEGLSVDWITRNIYWTDSSKDTLEVASLDTKRRKVLFNENLVNPRGIVVHPTRGKVFWSDWDRRSPKIEWANMDGTGRSIFLQGPSVQLPNSLAIDWQLDQVCYADAGTKKIECVDIDSKEVHTIAVNCTYPFGLAISSKHYYWTDWVSQKVESVDKHTFKRQPAIKVPLGGSGNKLYGMAAVPDQCIVLTNDCLRPNACPSGQMCLPDGKGSRTCI